MYLFIYSFIHSLSKYSLGISCVPSTENSAGSKTLLSQALILQTGGCDKVLVPWERLLPAQPVFPLQASLLCQSCHVFL